MKIVSKVYIVVIILLNSCTLAVVTNRDRDEEIRTGMSLYSRLKDYPSDQKSLADHYLWNSFVQEYENWSRSFCERHSQEGWKEFRNSARAAYGDPSPKLSWILDYPSPLPPQRHTKVYEPDKKAAEYLNR